MGVIIYCAYWPPFDIIIISLRLTLGSGSLNGGYLLYPGIGLGVFWGNFGVGIIYGPKLRSKYSMVCMLYRINHGKKAVKLFKENIFFQNMYVLKEIF